MWYLMNVYDECFISCFVHQGFFIYLIRGIISAPTVLIITPTDHTYETARSMWPRKKIINREPNYNIWRSPRFIFKLGFNPQLQRPINNLTYKRMFLFFYNSLVAPKMHVFLRFAPGGGLISLASMITWYWSNQRLGVTWSEKLAYEWHLWRIYRQLAECWSLDVHYEFIYPESDFR